jgi:hypothetical protein
MNNLQAGQSIGELRIDHTQQGGSQLRRPAASRSNLPSATQNKIGSQSTMKTHRLNRMMALTALASGAAWLLTGCGTTAGYKRADKTGAGIAEYRDEVINVKRAVDSTLQSMDQVEAAANTDPRKAFEQFSENVAVLDSAAAKAEKRGQDMTAKGQAYFAQWEEQIAQLHNPEIKQLAQDRKARLLEAFNRVKKAAEPLKAQFNPWLSDVKDLQKYLSNDLTVGGVEAAKTQFAKTKADGLEVGKSMDALVAELNSLAATLIPAKVKPK